MTLSNQTVSRAPPLPGVAVNVLVLLERIFLTRISAFAAGRDSRATEPHPGMHPFPSGGKQRVNREAPNEPRERYERPAGPRLKVLDDRIDSGSEVTVNELGAFKSDDMLEMLRVSNPELHAALKSDFEAWVAKNPSSRRVVDARALLSHNTKSKMTIDDLSVEKQQYAYSMDKYRADDGRRRISTRSRPCSPKFRLRFSDAMSSRLSRGLSTPVGSVTTAHGAGIERHL